VSCLYFPAFRHRDDPKIERDVFVKMPIYQYRVQNETQGCEYCRKGFELMRPINSRPLRDCPVCGARVKKVISSFSSGFSKTSLDSRAKEKGFHKLKRVDKGKYEKLY